MLKEKILQHIKNVHKYFKPKFIFLSTLKSLALYMLLYTFLIVHKCVFSFYSVLCFEFDKSE